MSVQELADVWDMFGPPRMHYSVNAIEVWLPDVGDEEKPKDELWQVSSQTSIIGKCSSSVPMT